MAGKLTAIYVKLFSSRNPIAAELTIKRKTTTFIRFFALSDELCPILVAPFTVVLPYIGQ